MFVFVHSLYPLCGLSSIDSGEGLRPASLTPRTQSPGSGRGTPSGRDTPNVGECGEGDGMVREARARYDMIYSRYFCF